MQYITQCPHYSHPRKNKHARALSREQLPSIQIVKEQPIRCLKKHHSNARAQLNAGSSLRDAGGANRDRTDDLLLAKQALSQLSYGPRVSSIGWWVWMDSNHRPPPYQDGALTN